MEDFIIFISINYVGITLIELWRKNKLIKHQVNMIKLHQQVIDNCQEKEVIYNDMIVNYELLNDANEIIIKTLKK
tara:strand:+ start:66 stop:290 length:225 start_codon:yes stop_codon:yes gene_type:complete